MRSTLRPPRFGLDQLPGSYKLGAWYNTSKTADVVDNTQGALLAFASGAPLQRDGAYGGYVNFEQKVTRAPPDQLGIAVGRTHVNDRVAAVEEAQNAAGLAPVGVGHWGDFSAPQRSS